MADLILIDDHKIILEGLGSMFANDSEFSLCATFQDPVPALDYLEEHKVDLVVTDLSLPSLSGEDVVVHIKQHFPAIKVLVLSMHDEHSVIKELIERGADGYVLKSSGQDEIRKAIRTVLNGSRYFSDEVLSSLIHNQDKKDGLENTATLLTVRELEIIQLLTEGLTSKEIADKLFISKRTVDTHRSNIMRKLEVNSIASVIKYAFENKLVS